MMSRSKWKGPVLPSTEIRKNTEVLKRNSTILPRLVEQNVKIHNGKELFCVTIDELMVGHKAGEFAPTRSKFLFKKKKKKKKKK